MKLYHSLSFLFLMLSSCHYRAQYNEFGINYAKDIQQGFQDRSTSDVEKAYGVKDGEITWVNVERLCIKKTASWIGRPDLTIGVSISTKDGQRSRGVISAKEVQEDVCLPFKGLQVIDPFEMKESLNQLEIKLDIIESPSVESRLLNGLLDAGLSSGASMVGGPTAKVGDALFTTFITPRLKESRTHVEYIQGFHALDLNTQGGLRTNTWQTGLLVLIPARGAINGKVENYSNIETSNLYLDKNSILREGNPSSQKSSDPYFRRAPYLVLNFQSSTRAHSATDNELSKAMRLASSAMRTGYELRSEAAFQEAKNSLKYFSTMLAINRQHIGQYGAALFEDARLALEFTSESIAEKDPLEKLNSLNKAIGKLDKLLDGKSHRAKLTSKEKDVLESLRATLMPTKEELVAQGEFMLASIKERKQALMMQILSSSSINKSIGKSRYMMRDPGDGDGIKMKNDPREGADVGALFDSFVTQAESERAWIDAGVPK